jgi:UDP-glucose 4-epimerase
MKTIITGASGYIGLHLIEKLLSNGHKVTAIARSKKMFSPFLENKNLVIETLDLTDSSWYERVLLGHDCCIHLALIWGNENLEIEGYDTTISARFFEAVGKVKIKRALYISSTAVHRTSVGNIFEDHSFTTNELYGVTKAAGELFFRSACARNNITGIVLRPSPVVGKPAYNNGSIRSPRTFENFIDLASKNQPITIKENSKIQFCDIYVLVQAIEMLTRSEKPQDIYFCVSEKEYFWKDIATYIIKKLHSTSEVIEEHMDQTVSVHYKPDRLKKLLGFIPDSKSSIYEHIDYLIIKRNEKL